jgi:imidazolonepropionase-like amidohydrolase
LHGSANPIGGQAALIKLKWGSEPADLLYPNAPKFIKFALGENVKQTNWGDFNTVRFPQTRMGVEQVFYHSFKKAKAYAENKKAYEELSDKKKLKQVKPLVDYELEVLNEILDSKRFVTCHSYIQSEINMLMKVADSMEFTLNTFTHILEGYKVADKMKAHGAGGSTFADWWAYKFEVNDAIPYNATILNDLGIVTAINSDDAEMARRLNQEAGKIVKYGQTSQEDAWKMVTLNPAKLLHIDDKVGSIKVGKDADIVIWSDNPLSINAITEKTFVDGVLLFDIDQQQELIKRNQLEKSRILLKMSSDKGQKKEFKPKKKGHYHCDTIEQL